MLIVAIAAMIAITKYKLKRILIVDWDVHFGNRIHKMFESDPRVLYFSLHRYHNKRFWPHLKEGNYDSIGTDEGLGFNINVAWNKGKMGDSEYIYAFNHILLPIIKEYQPELILVSAGFDSGVNDPLGKCCIAPNGYAHMTKMLMDFADGNVVLVLEGGYNLNTTASSMVACVATLLGDPVTELTLSKPQASAIQSISNTIYAAKKYWNSLLNFNEMFLRAEKTEESSTGYYSSSDDSSPDLI